MSLLIHRPDGASGDAPATAAAGLRVLSGKRIGLLDNAKPNADVVLKRIADRLAERCGAELVLHETKNAALPCEDQVLERIAAEVQVVLTGTAD